LCTSTSYARVAAAAMKRSTGTSSHGAAESGQSSGSSQSASNCGEDYNVGIEQPMHVACWGFAPEVASACQI